MERDVANILTKLFKEAETKGGLDYIFTLVRVEGIKCNHPDPLLELRSKLEEESSEISDKELFSRYCSMTSIEEPLALVANLVNCSSEITYNSLPFRHLWEGEFPEFVKPTPSKIAKDLVELTNKAGKPEIGKLIETAYSKEILNFCSSGSNPSNTDLLLRTFKLYRSFLSALLEIYFVERLKFKNLPKINKLPRFEVLELLVNEDYGLYGFRIHFSNGSSAVFERHTDSTVCTNVNPQVPISLMVGNIDELKDEWRVGNKRLYEIGLPGRYNELGEWKPLIYPGKSEDLQKESRLLSDDPEVQGVLFYMMCTGHRVIEFVVRTTVELPKENISYADRFHLWKCPPIHEDQQHGQNILVYDGWLEIDSVKQEYIRSAIDTIGVILNRFAFTYNASIDWRLKYTTILIEGGRATPSEEDYGILEKMLQNFLDTKDSIILDAAVDWYNRGRSSRNVFTAFLCYHIALESVAISIVDGNASLGLNYPRRSKSYEKEERIACIKEKHDSIYSTNPVWFVQEAYSDCVYGVKNKTRRVVELVFGTEHKHMKALFQKQDGYSLNDIRGKLAHGAITLLDRKHEMVVSNRVHEIAEISREFLTRIMFRLKPTDPLPSWSGKHLVSFATADPRTTLVATTAKIFPNKDWRIRAEWCD